MRDLAIGAVSPVQKLDKASDKKGDTNDRENAHDDEGVNVVAPI